MHYDLVAFSLWLSVGVTLIIGAVQVAGWRHRLVIGGLIVSTTLSLLVVPTIYLWVARNVEPRMGGFHRGAETHPPAGEEDFKEVPISAIE